MAQASLAINHGLSGKDKEIEYLEKGAQLAAFQKWFQYPDQFVDTYRKNFVKA